MIQGAIAERLSLLDTACLCDAAKALEVELRVMDPGIRPLRAGLKLLGVAHTVRCYNDFLTVIKALADARRGEVIVIDSQGSTKALTGELFPSEALRKGLAGIVNDGPCRDSAAVRNLKLPYYARSVHPMAGTTNCLFETQVPVQCGGVTVAPGEVLIGDDDGVVVTNMKDLEPLIPVAEDIQQQEDRLLRNMGAGVSLLEMLNFEQHCADLRDGKDSKLEFRV